MFIHGIYRFSFAIALQVVGLVSVSKSQDSLFVLVYPRQDLVDVSVRGTVTHFSDSYRYEYSVFSSSSSQQMVWKFAISNIPSLDSLRSPSGWLCDYVRRVTPMVSWGAEDSIYQVAPGREGHGFAVTSHDLPSIKTCYATGWVEVPVVETEPDSIVGGRFPEDSYPCVTIGPGEPVGTLSLPSLVDSLATYVAESRILGWITAQPTSDKYAGYFATTKSQLLAGDIRGAMLTLGTVLHDVNVDSSSTLTSEAYALIRFNTEYLLSKLTPSRDVKGGLFLIPQGSSNTLTLKARPAFTFTSGDTLVTLTATLRWPVRFGVTLGTVTSSYGFAKVDTPVTVGDYRYRRFLCAPKTVLGWTSKSD